MISTSGLDDIRNDVAQKFVRLLTVSSLGNLVNKPTYNSGHPLHLVNTKNHHCLVKSLSADAINTLFDRRNADFHLTFTYAKFERKLIRFIKKNFSFPDNLR